MIEIPFKIRLFYFLSKQDSLIAHGTGRRFTKKLLTTNTMDAKGKKVLSSPPSSSSDSQATQVLTQEKAWASIFKVMRSASNTSELFYNWARTNRPKCHICENQVNPDHGRLCGCTQRYCMRCLGNLVWYLVACNEPMPDEQLVSKDCLKHGPDDKNYCCRFCCLPERYWVEQVDWREEDDHPAE